MSQSQNDRQPTQASGSQSRSFVSLGPATIAPAAASAPKSSLAIDAAHAQSLSALFGVKQRAVTKIMREYADASHSEIRGRVLAHARGEIYARGDPEKSNQKGSGRAGSGEVALAILPKQNLGREVWTNAIIKDAILQMVHRPMEEQTKGKALAKLMTVDRATFAAALPKLYQSFGNISGTGSLYDYMEQANASFTRIQEYASKVQHLIHAPQVSEIRHVNMMQLAVLYPALETISTAVVVHYSGDVFEMEEMDITILDVQVRRERAEEMVLTTDIVLRAGVWYIDDLVNPYMTSGTWKAVPVGSLRLKGLGADLADLLACVNRNWEINSALNLSTVTKLHIGSACCDYSEGGIGNPPDMWRTIQVAMPKVQDAQFKMWQPVTTEELADFTSGWPDLTLLRIEEAGDATWAMDLEMFLGTVAKECRGLRTLICPAKLTITHDAAMPSLFFELPPTPKYPNLQEFSSLVPAPNDDSATSIELNVALLLLVGKQCSITVKPVGGGELERHTAEKVAQGIRQGRAAVLHCVDAAEKFRNKMSAQKEKVVVDLDAEPDVPRNIREQSVEV